jgi:hypothetical protein
MYELWDAESRNMIDTFGSATEADVILTDIARNSGPKILDPLFLVYEDENEESELIAEGQAILVAIKRLSAEEKSSAASRRAG